VRVVLDTNVLVSALHFGGRPRRLLDDVLRGDHTLIIGPAILGELEAVLVDTCGWTRDRAAAVRAELEAIAEVVTPVDVPRVCRDPDDDQILAIAVSGAADALVTGDADLLAVGMQGVVSVISIAGFETMGDHEGS
jgi:putative PIN family toxin of toxin-antitoxin system